MMSPPSNVPLPSTFLCACKPKALRATSPVIPPSPSPFRTAPPWRAPRIAHVRCGRGNCRRIICFQYSGIRRAKSRAHIRLAARTAARSSLRTGKTRGSHIRRVNPADNLGDNRGAPQANGTQRRGPGGGGRHAEAQPAASPDYPKEQRNANRTQGINRYNTWSEKVSRDQGRHITRRL